MLHGGRGTIAALAVLAGSLLARGASAGRALLKGPYLTGLSSSGVVVRFELAVPAAATVQVTREGPEVPAGLRTFESREVESMHEVPASGLEPGATYRYVVRSGGATVGEGRFATAPRPEASAAVTFLVYGDNRTDAVAHASVARAMEQVPSDFVVNTGDLVDEGASDEAWQSFFDVEGPLLRNRPLFSVIGNHEIYHDPSGARFLRYLGLRDASGTVRPYGTARVGNARLFFLDAHHPWDAGDERQWLEHELALADGEAGLVWRIVVVHEGPWSAGPHGPSERLAEGRVPEVLARHKVDLLLSGHDHTYQRGDAGAIKYIVSGGGGAPLYGITRDVPTTRRALAAYHFVEVRTSPEQIRIVARRPDGQEIDRCGLRKGTGWDCDPPPAPPAPAAPPQAPASTSRILPLSTASPGGCALSGRGGPRAGAWRGLAAAGIGLLAVLRARRRHRRG